MTDQSGSLGASVAIRLFYNPTILLTLALMAVIVMMILPIPAWMLDVGLTISFGLAILIFTTTLFIERPLDFSAFPTILLASLMLRLSLNVSSTKLIIGQGHTGPDAAGGVISGFANFVMAGNLFLGLVVFGVLLIVNFIVITKGAGRMAEVGARFALDGMPGKQLAIDSDMAAGAINHEEARARRKLEQEETTFFGSLDGASKFVKGDAIAGLLITLLNLVMGLAMGMGMHDMSFSDALETYAVLTVGDGLVSQIPSVIVSIAAALLLAKGGILGTADRALISQLGAYPSALATVAGLMALFALIPGLPFLPFMAGAIVLGVAAWRSYLALAKEPEEELDEADLPRVEKTLGDEMEIDEIHMTFSPGLVPIAMDAASGLFERVTSMRRHIATEFGFIIPEIRLTDDSTLIGGQYTIYIQGVQTAKGEVMNDHLLVLKPGDTTLDLEGEDVDEPVYGAPAMWVPETLRDEAMATGQPVATPNEVMATHLLEIIKQNFSKLASRRAIQRILDEFVNISDPDRGAANQRVLDEFIPEQVPKDLLQAVIRLLLDEKVSVRNLPLLLEAISDARTSLKSPEEITDYVRQKLAFQIVSSLQEENGTIPLIQLSPEWEDTFRAHETPGDGSASSDIALPPSEFNRLAGAVSKRIGEATAEGRYPAIVTPARRRRFVRTVLDAKGIHNPVLAFEEVVTNAKPALIGVA